MIFQLLLMMMAGAFILTTGLATGYVLGYHLGIDQEAREAREDRYWRRIAGAAADADPGTDGA